MRHGKMKKMLVVDDHEQITAVLQAYAEKAGFTVTVAHDGEAALALTQQEDFAIILLDVMMPKLDGFVVCQKIREHSNVPIIMITARGEDYEKIMGLEIGADDYIVKPFSPAEVMARVQAILRRIPVNRTPNNPAIIKRGTLVLDIEAYSAAIAGVPLELTKIEFELLWTLAEHPNKVYARENLLDAVWGMDYYGDARTVDSHIKRLRAKLAKAPQLSWAIETIWGVGYKFEEVADEAKN